MAGAEASVSPTCYPDLPVPELELVNTEDYTTDAGAFTRYCISVVNWNEFPDALFEAAPDLPACGLNTSASRTFVDIHAGTGARIYGFCALDSADDLTRLWFACRRGELPPDQVYVVLHDRRCDITYTSAYLDLRAPHAGPRILVDASKDGGVWWCPQAGSFDPNAPHQGRAMAEYLRSLGFTVVELARDGSTTITPELLASFDIVIRANECEPYVASEVVAYQDYVYTGGKLLLIGDYVRPGEQDGLALSFGILFQGISRGENVMDAFRPHPITEGASVMPHYNVGSGVVHVPPTAEMLGFLSDRTYLDLNDNNVQDQEEPTGACALGRMSFGRGEIVFSGDLNFWERVPQPLLDNTIYWLMDHSSSVGGTVSGIVTTQIDGANVTTDQTVQIPLDRLGAWDCPTAGLVVTPGDLVQFIITGIAR